MGMQLRKAIAKAQLLSLPRYPDRFAELQQVEDLTAFLYRSDNSHLTREEVSNLGKALSAAQTAGHGARMDFNAQRSRAEEAVDSELSMAISHVQQYARDVAGHGFRCRPTLLGTGYAPTGGGPNVA